MANSKYEYVKSFEVRDEIIHPNIILVRVAGRNFKGFSEQHEFEKPYDVKALKLMNACAIKVMQEFPDIVIGYGFSDEYSFVFKTDTKIYDRRASKILSVVASLFSSAYVFKWNDFFPLKELKSTPVFKSRVISCASLEVLCTYLSWRQKECHSENLYNTCFWNLIASMKSKDQSSEKSKDEVSKILKGSKKHDQNEMLFQLFNINYKSLPNILRQGSFVMKTEVAYIVKYLDNGSPVKRLTKEVKVFHAENIVAPGFWNEHSCLVSEFGRVQGGINKLKQEYLKSFLCENNLMPATWIVIRIDGCHFKRFSKDHQFNKPNDEQALNLMNTSAIAMMKELNDIIFSYGVSDEYSFILKKDTSIYGRRASEIVSAFVSFFSSVYAMQWKVYIAQKALKNPPPLLKALEDPPHFDGRSVCYPSSAILLDYLAWRQVDCHINNQYNTCFWLLVKSRKSKNEAEAHNVLRGTQTQQKNDLLMEYGIDYNTLPAIFRYGSSIFWDKEENMVMNDNEDGKKLVVEHCNIIDRSFWKAHPTILEGGWNTAVAWDMGHPNISPSCRTNDSIGIATWGK